MGPAENGIQKVQNSTPKFREKFLEILIDVLYGKKTTEDFDERILADPTERKKLIQQTNFLKDPSVTSLASSMVTLNSFDLCNPFSFVLTQVLPDGNPIKETFLKLDGLARTWQQISSGNFLGDGTVDIPITLSSDRAITFTGNQSFDINISSLGPKANNLDLNDQLVIYQTDDSKLENYSLIGEITNVTANTVTITVIRASVPRPPFQVNKNGENITDDRGNPILRKFKNLKLEVTKDPNPDIEVISQALIDVSIALDEVGLEDILESIESAPSYFPNLEELKRTARKLIRFQAILRPIVSQASDTAELTGLALQNRLTYDQAREASSIVREFDEAIKPFFNAGDRVVQGYFDTIQDLNSFFRNVIPYDFLVKFVKIVVDITKAINEIVVFLLGILKIINSVIKAITGVLKIVKTVLKVIEAVVGLLPSALTLVGIITKFSKFIQDAIAAIDRTIKFLESISNYLDTVVLYLTLIQQGLEVIIREGSLLAAKLDSCQQTKDTGLSLKLEASVKTIALTYRGLKLVTFDDLDGSGFYNDDPTIPGGGFRSESTDGQTFVKTTQGDLLFLSDTVIGFDLEGNLIFYAELESLSTGVVFNDTLGQNFRNFLNENFRFYTFDKFRNQQPLLLEADRIAFDRKEGRIREVDPEDIFGNYSEIYLGYTLKIQEERPTDQNSQVAIRRRGIALDNNELLVASTKLTFATDLNTIVQELKFILKKKVEDGVIGPGTLDTTPNRISDDDAIAVAESIGANPLAINNIKAENNNKITSNLSTSPDKEPLQTRVGNENFRPKIVSPTTGLVNDGGSNREPIKVNPLVQSALREFVDENPGLKKVSQTVARIDRLDSLQLSQLQRIPNGNNLTTEERIQRSKENILSNVDPNPDKLKEVSSKTQTWYEGLKGRAEADFEQLTLSSGGSESDFDKYFEKIVKDELKNWTRLLLNSGYSEQEVELGVQVNEIRENFRFEIQDDGEIIVKKRSGFKG